MLKVKNISEVLGKRVFTSEGDMFGSIEEVNLVDNRIDGWKIRISTGFAGTLGGARGVVIPHQFVKSIGDVFIINKAMLPSIREDSFDSLPQGELSGAEGEEDVI